MNTVVTPQIPEPPGLWAVVERIEPGWDSPEYLVKAPGRFGGPYWYSIGGEDGWGWGQVLSWPGVLRLVREGVSS